MQTNVMLICRFIVILVKKIAYVKLGDDSGDHFVNMLKNYTKVDVISDNNLDGLLTKLKSYNQVIIGFHKSNKHPWKSYRFKNKELVWLQEIARNKKVAHKVTGHHFYKSHPAGIILLRAVLAPNRIYTSCVFLTFA